MTFIATKSFSPSARSHAGTNTHARTHTHTQVHQETHIHTHARTQNCTLFQKMIPKAISNSAENYMRRGEPQISRTRTFNSPTEHLPRG